MTTLSPSPWPIIVPGARPEVAALADFKLAKSPAGMDAALHDAEPPYRRRGALSWSSFRLRPVTRDQWKKATGDTLR